MELSMKAAHILLILFLAPFLFLSGFIHLSVDDFCRYDASWEDLFVNIGLWLKTHNGRYTNAILSFLPVYKIQWYRLISFFSIIFFLISIYLFVSGLFKRIFSNDYNSLKFLLFVLFAIHLINQLPAIGEFFYWYAGITAYMYSSIAIVFLFLAMLYSEKIINKYLLIPILTIFAIGNNEFALVVTNIMVLSFLYYQFKLYKRLDYYLVFLLIIMVTADISVILSEGSAARLGSYDINRDLLKSLYNALYSSVVFWIRTLVSFNSLLFWLASLILMNRFKSSINRNRELLIFIILAFLIIWALFFVAYYSLGEFNSGKGRIGNYLSLTLNFLIFVILALLPKFKIPKNNIVIMVFMGIVLTNYLLGDRPTSWAYSDLIYGRAQSYNKEANTRYKAFKNYSSKVLNVSSIEMPKSLETPEILMVPTLERECFKEMILEKYNPNIEKFIFY